MLLKDLLDYLKYSELANLSVGGEKGCPILNENLPAILPHINLALLEIYKRFNVKTSELTLQLYTGKTNYEIAPQFADSSSSSFKKYIMDSSINPYKDDFLSIDKIYDELGAPLDINNTNSFNSVYMTSPTVIQVPWAQDEIALFVSYYAKPEKIDHSIQDTNIHIELPHVLLEPLMFYMGSRMYSNYIDGEIGEGRSYFNKYEDSCNKIVERGLLPRNETESQHFNNYKGWI